MNLLIHMIYEGHRLANKLTFKVIDFSYAKLFILIVCITFMPNKISKAQGSFSLQLNGGIIYPIGASRGFSGSLQLNYHINSAFNFYIYSGYSGWDRNKVIYQDEWVDHSVPYQSKKFDSYSEDNHKLIPVYIGSTYNFNTGKLLMPFVNIELGYSYLSYYSYEQMRIVSSVTGVTVNYIPDIKTKKLNSESLFGVGIGGGFLLPVSGIINLLLSLKLNSYINNQYYGLFSTKGTYTTLTAGFSYNI